MYNNMYNTFAPFLFWPSPLHHQLANSRLEEFYFLLNLIITQLCLGKSDAEWNSLHVLKGKKTQKLNLFTVMGIS